MTFCPIQDITATQRIAVKAISSREQGIPLGITCFRKIGSKERAFR
jgi:hypothetical protein